MNLEDLNALETLAKKATQGEWRGDNYGYIWGPNHEMIADDVDEEEYLVRMRGFGGRLPIEENRDFIVALHNAFPDLLALARAGIKTHTETPLTRRQYQVLKIIFEELKPTLRDIQKKMGYAETSSSQRIVNVLVREKFVRREKYVSGGLYITDKGREALKAYDDLTKDV